MSTGAVRLERIPRELAAISVLAEVARADHPSAPTARVYFFAPAKGPIPARQVRRAGGPPIGVSQETRPRFDGEPMAHLLTVDLDEVPELRAAPGLKDARAVAVFVSDIEENGASEPHTKESVVVALSQADIDTHGPWAGPPALDPEPSPFYLVPVDVPEAVFSAADGDVTFSSLDVDEFRYDDGEKLRRVLTQFVGETAPTPEARLAALRSELVNSDHVGGRVIHWSDATYGEDDGDSFLLQITEDLLPDVCFGETGTLYVFRGTAFWITHPSAED